jgi:Na+/H+ antiporter NhaA
LSKTGRNFGINLKEVIDIFIFMTVTNNIYQKQIKYHVYQCGYEFWVDRICSGIYNTTCCVRWSFRVKSPQKINKIKKHDIPDLYRSLHRIRFYLEFCLQFQQHGNVSIIKMWSLNGMPSNFEKFTRFKT